MTTRRSLWLALTTSAVLLSAASTAGAQSWPAKPIRWIVPYTPGGITDTVTRLMAQKLSTALGQPIVIENKPGANSIIGAEAIAKAPPDGYTFGTVIAAHAANATLYAGKLPFDTVKAYEVVSLVGIAPLIITANKDFPPTDVKSLIDYAKANPGKVNFGSSGIGAAAHLTTELLKQTAGIDMTHIPYKGTAPATQGLMGGEIQILIDTPSSMMPHVRSGKIKALAVTASKRVIGSTEVPTAAEAGGPALESSTWVMSLAPAGTPDDIVKRISEQTARSLGDTDIKERFQQLSIEAVGNAPAEARAFLEAEIAKWGKVITAAGVKAE
jgi:tripartite-type tricarboxylate transporter receptor subunit TctC